MGQARMRGSFEDRKAQSIVRQREEAIAAAEAHRKAQEAARAAGKANPKPKAVLPVMAAAWGLAMPYYPIHRFPGRVA